MIGKEKQIELNLELLDFNTIQSVLNQMGVKYKTASGEEKSPSIDEIKSVAKHCMEMAFSSSDGYFELGGFEAAVVNGFVEIKFVISKSNVLGALLGK